MSKHNPVISGVGLWTPDYAISNDELVDAYNRWAERYNHNHAAAIEAGELAAKPLSSAEFISKASGIHSRYVYRKEGILDIDRMRPKWDERGNDELSHQAEIAVLAAKKAMAAANKNPQDVDAIIVSTTYTQRYYPAISIEVQQALGIEGFGFDMVVACSSATFGLQRAYDMIKAGTANCVLTINPELTSPQINWCDRDSHFIFGDVATASIVESGETANSPHCYEILDTKAVTTFSSNIRSNFTYTSRADDSDPFGADKLFVQQGRKVFKEVCPMAAAHIESQIQGIGLQASDVKRWWLHQANISMNTLITKKLLGRVASDEEAPIVLDRYANTASTGSLVAFNLYHEDLQSGDTGVICSFGAGYSIGSLVIKKR